MPELELAAQAMIEQARQQGGRRVPGHWEKVGTGQTGRLIVEEAREMQARAIVMALAPRTGADVFGKAVEAVLSARPAKSSCRSIPPLTTGSAASARAPATHE